MRRLFLATCAAALSGCATTSFAPPPVAVNYDGDRDHSGLCRAGGSRPVTVTVQRNVAGAYSLVDTFIETYRCAAHSAANGRQAFEIPAFVATTGAALATAVGGGATYGIVGTAANAAFNAGGKYWDPKLKAGIYDHSLDALLCVKTEAVGIPAYKFDQAAAEAAEEAAASARNGQPASIVEVSAEQQYFEMVSAAAFSIERILAHRLSNMAPVDAGAVAAELRNAIDAARKAEEERKKKAGGGGGSGEGSDTDPAAMRGDPDDPFRMLPVDEDAEEPSKQNMVELDLAVLKPKLDECVIRAKL